MNRPWLTINEAAEALGVSRRTIYRMLADQSLRYVLQRPKKPTSRKRIPTSEIERLVSAR